MQQHKHKDFHTLPQCMLGGYSAPYRVYLKSHNEPLLNVVNDNSDFQDKSISATNELNDL